MIGGGAVGLAAALVSEEAGHAVTVFDPQGFESTEPSGEIEPRVWALGPRSIGLLKRLHVWRDDPRICPYQSMRVIDQTSDAAVHFSDARLGHLVEAGWLKCRLLEAVNQRAIELMPETVLSVSNRADVRLESAEMAFDCAVFAEGKKAQTALASGFRRVDGGYHQHAVVGTLACEQPHWGEAFQSFTTRGPLALLPLPDYLGESRVSLVWSMPEASASELKSLSAAQLESQINAASEGARGSVRFVETPVWIPLSQHHLKRDALGPCLAIGDTAHSILPLAGLGANLGLADVAALSAVLDQAGPLDGARIARTVERMRRLPVQSVMSAMGLFSDVFLSNDPWVRLGRSFAFRTADRHRQIRRLIQELAG